MKCAIAQGYRNDNPADDALTSALPKRSAPVRHQRALPHGEVAAAVAAPRAAGVVGRAEADALPWTVVCRGVVNGIEAVIHQTGTPGGVRRVDHMVRVRDYDASENRWVVERVWPQAARRRHRAGPETAGRVREGKEAATEALVWRLRNAFTELRAVG